MIENLNLEVPTPLCRLMNKYGSDKGMCHHNYTVLYFEIFKEMQKSKMNVFEMGLGTNNTDVPSNMGPDGKPGASLRGWRDFFESSKIYGGDIDDRILFTEDRISTYHCDQRDGNSLKKIFKSITSQNNFDKFDIIIDDGLHEYSANISMLESCIDFLKEGGFYIIEDIKEAEINIFNEYIEKNRSKFEYINLFWLENRLNIFNDNNVVVIKK